MMKNFEGNHFERYAVYFAPRSRTALARFGQIWFENGKQTDNTTLIPDHYIEAPRRYGFHATLKAPMRLAENISTSEYLKAVETLSKQLRPINLGRLQVGCLNNFLALLPDPAMTDDIANLSWQCVVSLDNLRAPLNQAEIEKRSSLSSAEMDNLKQWGYPYVGKQFRFHMTLTSTLDEKQIKDAAQLIENISEDMLEEAVTLDTICVFGDPGESMPFKPVCRFELKG